MDDSSGCIDFCVMTVPKEPLRIIRPWGLARIKGENINGHFFLQGNNNCKQISIRTQSQRHLLQETMKYKHSSTGHAMFNTEEIKWQNNLKKNLKVKEASIFSRECKDTSSAKLKSLGHNLLTPVFQRVWKVQSFNQRWFCFIEEKM